MAFEFDIAIGKSRYETRWRNETWTWDKLVQRLSKTQRTAETVAEYRNASRQRKGEIKDIGGFVGGYISGGKRKASAVLHRQLLTLDIDYGTEGMWDDIALMYSCACLVYSTHSHTKEKPRLRLIMPLDREVNADEYEAVARRVAANIGIDKFDDSTYQSERLMYWPSTPKNGEYIFEHQDGEPLNVDRVLATYRDWKDSSQWEVSSRVQGIIRKAMTKQGEPTEKPGAVGRFCRAYDIHEAIATYLSDVYDSTTDDNRYTYRQGSTAAGLVVYDDKFAYSHHGTDPTGGHLCNAFDLVRLHLYGLRDEETAEGTPVNRMPSYLAMEELVGKDERVKRETAEQTRQRLLDDFSGIDTSAIDSDNSDAVAQQDATDDSWLEKLETDKKGKYLSSAQNIITVLENAPGLKNNIRRNELIHADVITRNLPWRSCKIGTGKRWCDEDDSNLIVYFETKYGITGKDKILTVKNTIAAKHWFQPVRDYLNGLHWDGQERLDKLFIDCLGAKDTPLTRAVTRKALTAAVARTFSPGCKYDYITVLQGAEGIGKSTMLRWLGGDWFTDCITDIGGKEGREQIQGYWIEELGELTAIKGRDVESVKAFISCQTDSYRPAYGRTRQEFKRQCVFFATTNEAEFLKGDTGNRRFWLLDCCETPTQSPWELDAVTRDQVWAEAVQRYREGESLYLDAELEHQMRALQKKANEVENDARKGMIEEYLDKRLPVDWAARDINSRIVYLADDHEQEINGASRRDRVCALEIWCEVFHGRIDDDRVRYKVREINRIMDSLDDWSKNSTPRRYALYGNQRGYQRREALEAEEDNDI